MRSERPARRLPARRVALFLLVSSLLLGIVSVSRAPPAAASFLVPYSPTPVSDADLEGNPATGSWSDAVSVELPLENGAATTYGSATLHAKHDGTYVYFRVDGSVDVPWQSPSGSHFWFGVLFGPSAVEGHHKAGQDGVFFGDSTYSTASTLLPVDTNGGGKPPAVDTAQDSLGEMRATGSAAPYSFTAEWKRKLDTGDSADVKFLADGTTSYHLYATTDSDGGGSGGGTIEHNVVTNSNVVRFEVPQPGPQPGGGIRVTHTPPSGIRPGRQITITAVLTNATGASIGWRNATMAAEEHVPMTNLSVPGEGGWVYEAFIPAQSVSTQVRYSINATGPQGFRAESYFLTVSEPVPSGVTAAQQRSWILSLVASMSMAISVLAVLYWFTGRRLRRVA